MTDTIRDLVTELADWLDNDCQWDSPEQADCLLRNTIGKYLPRLREAVKVAPSAQGEDDGVTDLEELAKIIHGFWSSGYECFAVDVIKRHDAALRSRLAEPEHWPRIQDTPEWQAAQAEPAQADPSEDELKEVRAIVDDWERHDIGDMVNAAEDAIEAYDRLRAALASERAKRDGDHSCATCGWDTGDRCSCPRRCGPAEGGLSDHREWKPKPSPAPDAAALREADK